MVKDNRLFLRVLLIDTTGLKKKKKVNVYSEQLYSSTCFYRAESQVVLFFFCFVFRFLIFFFLRGSIIHRVRIQVPGGSHYGAAEMNLTRNHEVEGSIPGFVQWLSGLRIRRYCELWYRSQMWLGPGIAGAVVQAGSCSSD